MTISIKEARKKARKLKTLMVKGIDPSQVKRQQYIKEKKEITFKELHNKHIEEYSKIYTVH